MNEERKKKLTALLQIAMCAAIYTVLCLVLQPLSFGPIQFRFSEILCLLAIDHKWALWGCILGCFISNTFFGGLGIIDIVFGTLATAIGCLLAYHYRNHRIKGYPILSTLMIVLANAIIIGIELAYILDSKDQVWLFMIQVGIGELTVLGIGLLFYKRINSLINKK
ncbi:MAG: QueT transporter family protein [Erysipelotrichaceae bacterium]|nr:QueT transporter family protein [Erysipelotrichaceae bacterium]